MKETKRNPAKRLAFSVTGGMSLRGWRADRADRCGASEWLAFWDGGACGAVTCARPPKTAHYEL